MIDASYRWAFIRKHLKRSLFSFLLSWGSIVQAPTETFSSISTQYLKVRILKKIHVLRNGSCTPRANKNHCVCSISKDRPRFIDRFMTLVLCSHQVQSNKQLCYKNLNHASHTHKCQMLTIMILCRY